MNGDFKTGGTGLFTFLGPLKIFFRPLPVSLDLSLCFPERPFCPSPGLESSERSKASVGRNHVSTDKTKQKE